MSDATYPKTSKAPKAQPLPVDDYDDYEDYDEPEVFEDVEPQHGREPGPALANRGRIMALGFAALALVIVFSALIWLMSANSSGNTAPKLIEGGVGVPTILGWNANTSAESQAPAKGAFAPDFVWDDSANQAVSLSSFRGSKPVFVNFWGTWCPPCRGEMPAMETFYQKHKDEIQLIGVSMAPRDDPTIVLNFVKDAKYSWKFIHDGDYKVAEKYQVASVPSSYFIDRTGVIKAVQIGAMNEAQMESYFAQVR